VLSRLMQNNLGQRLKNQKDDRFEVIFEKENIK
jgi:hypothetical protein